MAIVSASIEANGYVLALVVSGTNSTASGVGYDADYPLTPNATPKLTMTSTHPGYDVSGGIAIANSAKTRSLIATKPIRQVAQVSNGSSSVSFVIGPKLPDETAASGGQFTVRIALSNWVYSTDTNLTLAALAGWRTGEAAAGPITVTNNSAVTCPIPIHRWPDVPYRLQRGSFDVEVLVFGFHPQGTQPVAAVKFTVTDGTTARNKTYWATALSSSTQFGDNLRCHRVTVDPSVATALTAGLLRIDAEFYPWIGAMRTTDPAGTKSMATLQMDGFLSGAQTPFVVAYDPGGTRYAGNHCAYVDYINGTTTASAAMIGTGTDDASALVAAKLVAPASRAKDVGTAMRAAQLAGYNYAAGNGQPAPTYPMILDGFRAVLAPQVHAGGLGTVTGPAFGSTTNEIYARVEGDPAATNGPRVDCIIRTSSGTFNSDVIGNMVRLQVSNCSIELGYVFSRYIQYWWFDNVEFRGQTGMTLTNTTAVQPPVGYGKLASHMTRCRMWKTGVSWSTDTFSSHAKLIRNCEHRRGAEAAVFVKNRMMSEAEDNSWTGYLGTGGMIGAVFYWADDAAVYDSICAYNDVRNCTAAVWNAGFLSAAQTSTPAYTANQNRRQVFFGNICERVGSPGTAWAASTAGIVVGMQRSYLNNMYQATTAGTTGTTAPVHGGGTASDGGVTWQWLSMVVSIDAMFRGGEQSQADMYECIIEANTMAGDRVNWGYNDSSPLGTVALTDSQQQNTYVNCRVAGNIFSAHFTKHDHYDDPAVGAQRKFGPAWAAWTVYPTGQQLVNGGNLYQITTGGQVGGNPPTGTGSGINPAGTSVVYNYISVFTPDPRYHGVRPYNINCYASVFGVGQRDNLNLATVPIGVQPESFNHEFEGINCRYDGARIDPKFTNNASSFQFDGAHLTAAGVGNYAPAAGSPALSRVTTGNSDVDLFGSVRT